MSRNPHYPNQNPNPTPNPFYNPSESDMDPYNHREIYQSDGNTPGGQYDNHNYDPYGMFSIFYYFIPRGPSPMRRNSIASQPSAVPTPTPRASKTSTTGIMPPLQSPSTPAFALASPTSPILQATMALLAPVNHTPHGLLSARSRYQKSVYSVLF